jgi:hypothetical protein
MSDVTASPKAKIRQMQENPQPPAPNPELIKAQAEQMTSQARMHDAPAGSARKQAQGQVAQVEAQLKMQMLQDGANKGNEEAQEYVAKQQEMMFKHQNDLQKLQMET